MQPKPTAMKLIGNRFLTLCIMIRTTPWEVSRDVRLIDRDESPIHTLEIVQRLSRTVRRAVPNGRITWGFTLNALEDTRPNYVDIRKFVADCQKEYGDEVSYFPGYFPALYLPRQRVNTEISEALQIISNMVGGGYRPKAVIGGFLSADNMRHLSEQEDIHVAHGVIWSQHAIDAGGADGSPSYPFYPSREHLCKPAQSDVDFIDCVNLDGWSVDFLCGKMSGVIRPRGTPFNGANSRRGVGPIETYCEFGLDLGHLSVMHTQSLHFDTGFELNGFGWIPNIWEAALVKQQERGFRGEDFTYHALEKWLSETVKRWPDVRVIPFGDFGEAWRSHYANNDAWDYRFIERGLGFSNSWGNEEICWLMNRRFRLALLRNWHKQTPPQVIDFTRYDLPAREPADPSPERPNTDWSLINRINQKGLRPEDTPVPIGDLTGEELKLITVRYPHILEHIDQLNVAAF